MHRCETPYSADPATRDAERRTWAHTPWEVALLVIPALVLGGIARTVPILSASFPLNDGGLFLVMSQDLVRSDFVLPAFTTYNDGSIPFAYPPLALYLLAFLSALGLDPIQLLRWIPLIVSIAIIPLVYVVSNELLGSWRIAGVAALAFALIPRSYEWTITGGGLTRGLGMALGLLAIWQGIRLIRAPSRIHIALTGLFGGLTLLTHPEASVFVVISLAVFLAQRGRKLRTVVAMSTAGLIGIAVAAPWWITVLTRHGAGLLIGAANSRTEQLPNALRGFLFGDFTGASALDVFLGVGFVGLLIQLGRGRYLIPVWLVVLVVFIIAAGFTFAALPWAMLIAIAVMEVLLPAAGRLFPPHVHARAIVVGGLLGAAMLATLATGYSAASPVHALSDDQRSAMTWISESVPEHARFVVITGVEWPRDATSEWFPALTQRESVATVQGYEWTPTFGRRQAYNRLLQSICAARLRHCLVQWRDIAGVDFDYVYIPRGGLEGIAGPPDCCPALREQLDREARVVYRGDGATIIRVDLDRP